MDRKPKLEMRLFISTVAQAGLGVWYATGHAGKGWSWNDDRARKRGAKVCFALSAASAGLVLADYQAKKKVRQQRKEIFDRVLAGKPDLEFLRDVLQTRMMPA